MIWLLACGDPTGVPRPGGTSREVLVDEARELATAPGPGRTWTWRATLRGWRYSAGWDGGPTLGGDAVYVGWELGADRQASLRGDTDQVWAFPSLDQGRAAYAELAIEPCADADHLAFRVLGGDELRVRVVIPDEAGAAVAVAPTEDCQEALRWIGSAEDWQRDRSTGARICEHLYRLNQRQDAIRCLLREPLRSATGRATRQELPRAADDPRFDADLLAVLAPDAPGDRSGYAPYRVRQLLDEVRDRAGLQALARDLLASPERSAWRAAVLAEVKEPGALSWVDEALAGSTDEQAAIVEILLAALQWQDREALRPRFEQARQIPARTGCAPEHQVIYGRCGDPATLARRWLGG